MSKKSYWLGGRFSSRTRAARSMTSRSLAVGRHEFHGELGHGGDAGVSFGVHFLFFRVPALVQRLAQLELMALGGPPILDGGNLAHALFAAVGVVIHEVDHQKLAVGPGLRGLFATPRR
jgi:hypothetical protein